MQPTPVQDPRTGVGSCTPCSCSGCTGTPKKGLGVHMPAFPLGTTSRVQFHRVPSATPSDNFAAAGVSGHASISTIRCLSDANTPPVPPLAPRGILTSPHGWWWGKGRHPHPDRSESPDHPSLSRGGGGRQFTGQNFLLRWGDQRGPNPPPPPACRVGG